MHTKCDLMSTYYAEKAVSHRYEDEVGKGKMYFTTFSAKTGYTCCVFDQNDMRLHSLRVFLKNPSEANSNNCSSPYLINLLTLTC